MLLKCRTSLSRNRESVARGGWTLPEMMVAIGAGAIVMVAVVYSCMTLSTTMAAVANYNDLNAASRHTLDVMSQDLRNTARVTSESASAVTVSNEYNGDVISYAWNGIDSLVRTINGTNTTMLTNCDYLNFSFYQRNPTNNFDFVTSHTYGQTKLISVTWRCSRTILGVKLNTESVQTAKICIRN